MKETNIKDEKIKAKIRTLKTLFEFLELDIDDIKNLGNDLNRPGLPHEKKERSALLESASVDLTKKFGEWWKQGNYEFNLFADGDFFRITVCDEKRKEKIDLEARSTGLQWFFSFFLVFLNESTRDNNNTILLLDEPGVTLHPMAQKNLFEFFNNLSKKNQLLYTTHSPFMVDSNNLETVRSVYVNNNGESVVSSNLRASEREYGIDQTKSIFSVHAALGLTVSDTLLINCNPILVEGPSDQIYFSVLKNLMISQSIIHPLKEMIFIPTGGVKGIGQTATIVSVKNNDYPYVILDGDNSGRDKKKSLERCLYSGNKEKLIDLTTFSFKNGEVEDLFPKKSLAKIADGLFFRASNLEDEFDDFVIEGQPFVNQLEEFAKKNSVELPQNNEWKIKLAEEVKKTIIRGKIAVFSEDLSEFQQIKKLFQLLELQR
jgi:predicted ATP-dependent endonuclease of OLD family